MHPTMQEAACRITTLKDLEPIVAAKCSGPGAGGPAAPSAAVEALLHEGGCRGGLARARSCCWGWGGRLASCNVRALPAPQLRPGTSLLASKLPLAAAKAPLHPAQQHRAQLQLR